MQNSGTLAPESLVSMGPRPHLWFCAFKTDDAYHPELLASLWVPALTFVAFACKTATLGPEIQVSMGPRPHQWFFAFKRATLAPELQVSMCPRPHLSLLCMQNNVISIQNYASLYGTQP